MCVRHPIAVAVLVLAALSVNACGERSKHAADGDTGAAAPATQRDMSATPAVPDPTTTSAATSQPMTRGDTVTRSTKTGGAQSKPAARRQP
jgi:hypothetical protein